ncbi:hypothetical protein RM69_06065 [Mesotoga sp. SC_NapDC3]|nr:hypothetical protein RM69_06065 [Mesotoga sp. SC_NapDC3]PXF33307.1 hypothetical protein EU77_14470 [Mesotoga sp. SC_NapDC]
MKRFVSPYFRSRFLVSEANVSTMLFLSARRSTDLKSDTPRRQEHAATPLKRGLRSREKEREEDEKIGTPFLGTRAVLPS